MPDSPDYQKYLLGSVRFSLQDMGELAVRLGSPSVIDRRGEVVVWDDFRHGLSKWTYGVFGSGSAVSITADGRITSAYRGKLTAGASGYTYAYIQRFFPLIVSDKYGFEIIFAINGGYNYIQIEFIISEGTSIYTFGWKHEAVGGKLSILASDGSYTLIGSNINIATIDDYPVLSKMRVNILTGVYDTFRFSNTDYDVNGIILKKQVFSTIPYSYFRTWVFGNGSSASNYIVESFGITANEP